MKDSVLTDAQGNTYRIVANWWMKGLTALCLLNFVILMLIVAGLIDNIRRVEDTMSFSSKFEQRQLALSDMANSRVEAEKWAYEAECREVKSRGQECMTDPKWYADPAKYPLIANDPMGAGLFPPNNK